jgi:phytanoyl-CoA hydroxylase
MDAPLTDDLIATRLYRTDRVHTPLALPDAVDDEQIRRFAERGFLAVENVFSAGEIESAKRAISDLIASPIAERLCLDIEPAARERAVPAHDREPFVRKLMWFTKHEPRLHAMCWQERLIGIVRRLLGPDVNMIQDMALLKPAHIGREKPWHQDAAYFLLDPPTGVLGTWTALDEATPQNGCMHVIPGSHLGGAVPHYHDRDCQIADQDVDVARDVMVPLKPGGVMFFSALLHHGTPPNRSPQRRRALQFHFARAGCRKIDPAQHQTHFHDGMGYAACTEAKPNLGTQRR